MIRPAEINNKMLLALLLAPLFSAACAREVPTTVVDAGSLSPAISLSSNSIYTGFLAAAKQTDLTDLRSMTVQIYYQKILEATLDGTLEISDLGISLHDSRSQLASQAEAVSDLSKLYPTMGDLIDAGVVSVPTSSMNLSDFQGSLRQLSGAASGLGLDNSVNSVNYVGGAAAVQGSPASRTYTYTSYPTDQGSVPDAHTLSYTCTITDDPADKKSYVSSLRTNTADNVDHRPAGSYYLSGTPNGDSSATAVDAQTLYNIAKDARSQFSTGEQSYLSPAPICGNQDLPYPTTPAG